MEIKDIVNRDIVNLDNCESEPIHIPGSIQPHGFLLALSGELTIDFCSGNTADFIGSTPGQLLGRNMSEVVPAAEAQKIRYYIDNILREAANPHVFTYNEVPYNTAIKKSGNHYICEFEPFPDGSMTLPDLYKQTRKFVAFMEEARNLQDLCQRIAEETRRITGYDRVMVYRFDKDYNGEVFAESKIDSIEPFLGLNYPHTDIPIQARQLYLTNLMRMIADVEYAPVPIYTAADNDNTNKSLDLSLSVLRSVSPVHLEYLKNMGVGGTLTISLILDKKLWGLITCHHYSAKNLPHYTRLAALLQGHFLTSQIKVREEADELDLSHGINERQQQLLQLLTGNKDDITPLLSGRLLGNLVNANGAAIIKDNIIYKSGEAPADEEIQNLATWLQANTSGSSFVTARLADVYPAAEKISRDAAGLIYHRLGTTEGNCIIWFRPEVEKVVNWAGDPEKAIVKNPQGMLSPRKSFELWKQFVKLQSRDWKKAEINAASSFASALERQMTLADLSIQEIKYRLLSQKLQAANDELANINWIGTHDLKEPLRKIQIFASTILESNQEIPASVSDAVSRMQRSAQRMQSLINDLLSYSRVGNEARKFTPYDLNEMLKDILEEQEDEFTQHSAVIHASSLPIVPAVPFQLRQCFSNLISNSLKFAKENVGLVININCETIDGVNIHGYTAVPGKEYYRITLADNGIGFENSFAGRIFDVFQRLHNRDAYSGTGVGLAICKKIIENHQGYIDAKGEEGVGAIFTIYLPAQRGLL